MKKLILIGAGGFGREVAWLVERINDAGGDWDLLGFLDDSEEAQGKIINGYPVLGTTRDCVKYPDAFFACTVGAAKVREQIIQTMTKTNKEIKFATLIDPSVIMSEYVTIGEGSIICAGTIITVNVTVGNHVIINLNCTIGHDDILKDFVTLYPSVCVSGRVCIDSCSEIGTGAQIIQEKSIASYAVVGAGAVVIRDIPEKCTAVGNPAKPIKFSE